MHHHAPFRALLQQLTVDSSDEFVRNHIKKFEFIFGPLSHAVFAFADYDMYLVYQ